MASQQNPNELFIRSKLQELVNQIDPRQSLDADVEEVLMEVAEDFALSAIDAACNLAKHRGSTTLETRDLHLHLQRNYGIYVPGFALEGQATRPLIKRTPQMDVHKQRLIQVRSAARSDAMQSGSGSGAAASSQPQQPHQHQQQQASVSPPKDESML